MMLYELDDIEKRALVMEIKPEIDPVDEARELLSKATPGPWEKGKDIECQNEPDNCWHVFEKQAEIFPPLGEAGPVATVSQCDFDNAALIAAEPRLLNSLIARIEAQAEDIRFLGDRLEVQADVMSKVVAERNRMREALRSVPLLVEAAKGILNVYTWRGKKGYEAALRDGIRELQAAVKDVPDVAGMLLNLTALSPKGEQKK